MFDENFFKTSIRTHLDAKAKEGADQPSLAIRLHSGQDYVVNEVLEVGPGWVVVQVYPPGNRRARRHSTEDRKAGAPQFDLDRLAIPYGNISLVVVTLEKKRKGLGYASQ